MLILILLIYLFVCPGYVSAAPQISVNEYPSSLNPNSSFLVNFLVTNANIGGTYYYKFFGGIGDSTSAIKTTPNLSYNSPWINFPNFVVDLGGSAQVNSSAYLIPDAVPGLYNLKIRIAQTSNTSSGVTSPFYPLNVFILEPTISTTPIPSNTEPTEVPTPLPTNTEPVEVPTPLPTNTEPVEVPSITPFVSPEPTAKADSPLIISEIMANSNTGELEWIEIYNPSSESISLKNICFYDASFHSRCFPDTASISPGSYYSHPFSTGFLNNDGDTVNFLNTSIIYPSSPKNFTYSRQPNNSWCFANGSQNLPNNDCSSISQNSEEDKYPPPPVNLQFIPDSVNAGDDFNLVFNLKSSDLYSMRLTYPFGSQYFPFGNYKDGYSWLTMPLSVSKKLPAGKYPLSFHLKKNGSSHLYDYQQGEIIINPAVITPKPLKSKVLGASTSCPQCVDNSANVNYYPASTLRKVLPDANFFSWPFLFAGSILFLSPILFPKLYSD